MLWLQKLKKDDLCWEEGNSLGGWVFVVGGGAAFLDAGVGEEGEIGEGRVSSMVIYSLLLMESPMKYFCRWFY
jgi:hypothetical protein